MTAIRGSPLLQRVPLSQLAPIKWFDVPSRTVEKAKGSARRVLDGAKARETYERMRAFKLRPSVPIVVMALKTCSEKWDLIAFHNDLVADRINRDVSVANTLIDMYSQLGMAADARKIFDAMATTRDAVSWNAMIKGYVHNGLAEEALDLFSRIKEDGLLPNARTFLAAIQACAMVAAKEHTSSSHGRIIKRTTLARGSAIHRELVKSQYSRDVFVASALVDMYSKCGSLEDAKRVFEKMEFHDVVSWTSMIFGHASCGKQNQALALFTRMKEEGFVPDSRTYVAALGAVSDLAAAERKGGGGEVAVESLAQGRALHSEIKRMAIKADVILESALVEMYVKCGSLDDASSVFGAMARRDGRVWTSMIAGFSQAGDGEQALRIFARMQEEGFRADVQTLVAVLGACASFATREGRRVEDKLKKDLALQKGIDIHAKIAKMATLPNLVVENALVNMYAKCGSLDRAREIFDAMVERDLVSWNSMILGLVHNDDCDRALKYFSAMQQQGFKADSRTLVAVFKACSSLVALETGRRLHLEARSFGFESDLLVASSIVDFYGKCGSMMEAQRVFDSMKRKDSVTWTALIAGYSCCGDIGRVLELLDEADNEVGVDSVTLLCVLACYSHAGMVEEGKRFFEAMASRYGIDGGVEHIACVVDLLSRANRLEEAAELASKIPREASTVAWMTVLGACSKWKNVKVGELAFRSMSKEEGFLAPYVLMSNIYAAAGMWEQRASVRETMAKISSEFSSSRSRARSWWVDLAGVVHSFPANLESERHPQMEEIVAKLRTVFGGDPSEVTSDEDHACEHSERLAVGCALVNSPAGADVRISKSTRTCGACHKLMGAVSKRERCVVVCKDASRFLHVFQDGQCSCGDLW